MCVVQILPVLCLLTGLSRATSSISRPSILEASADGHMLLSLAFKQAHHSCSICMEKDGNESRGIAAAATKGAL